MYKITNSILGLFVSFKCNNSSAVSAKPVEMQFTSAYS